MYLIYLSHLPSCLVNTLQGLALHIVRSLGQAFDVCHKANPKPLKKKKKEGEGSASEQQENGEESEAAKQGEGQGGGGEGGVVTGTSIGLDAAMKKVSLENGNSTTAASTEPAVGDLSTLIFDPFAMPFPMGEANGTAAFMPGFGGMAAVDPFQSLSSFAPLTVSNFPTTLPDFPDGVDPSSVTIPPPHLAYISRPRPRASTSSQPGQVRTHVW